jgi:hypothetical protein
MGGELEAVEGIMDRLKVFQVDKSHAVVLVLELVELQLAEFLQQGRD